MRIMYARPCNDAAGNSQDQAKQSVSTTFHVSSVDDGSQ